MKIKCKVFIATSLDGFIADSHGSIDWLHSIPNPTQDDMGYNEFIKSVDALIMGRKTFETVCSFDIEWPYAVPVFVLSDTLKDIPARLQGKAHIISGNLSSLVKDLQTKGYKSFYIDGGSTIQSFLKKDMIDEMIITTIPILLGGGVPLFGELENSLNFKCISSKIYLNSISQSHYIRMRELSHGSSSN